MTREEQINLYLKERNIPITSLEANSIIEGINWADEHPNLSEEEQVGMGGLGMMWQEKNLIEKACELLTRMIREVTYKNLEDNSVEHYDKMEFIEDFKRAMEE